MKKLLFTPGPLSTSKSVKEAMLEDMGSRDYAFMSAIREIRDELLELAHAPKSNGYECVIMQGSGTFGIESTISSILGSAASPPEDILAVFANGAYGERIIRMASVHKIKCLPLRFPEDQIVSPRTAEEFLQANPSVTHVACIHSETTTGLFNPIQEIGTLCKKYGKIFVVDAMSSFGGVEFSMPECNIDFLVSSSNKCIEGVPGFSFVLARKTELEKAKGRARSLSLDLFDQWAGLEANGQFSFTPPTLSIMAFRQALRELKAEGGIAGREKRYRENKSVLDAGMKKLGFKLYLKPEIQGPIITSFLYPNDPKFNFENFYKKLNDRGFVIYPGKLGKTDAFRIGNIGQIFPDDVRALVRVIDEVLKEDSIIV